MRGRRGEARLARALMRAVALNARALLDVFLRGFGRVAGRLEDFVAAGATELEPGSGDDRLKQPGERCGEQCAPDAEDLGAGDEGDQPGGRVDADRFAHDARSDHVAFDHVDQDEIGQDDQPGGSRRGS